MFKPVKPSLYVVDVVTELLGADLMEHNILHGGIGVAEALEVLKEFHDITKHGQAEQPQRKYLQKILLGDDKDGDDMQDVGEEDELKTLADILGVEEVTYNDIEMFQESLKTVEPRDVEGFGFGKISGHPNLKLD